MYLEIFMADFAVFCVFLGISRDFAEIPEFRRSATERNIRSPELSIQNGRCDAWKFDAALRIKKLCLSLHNLEKAHYYVAILSYLYNKFRIGQ